MPTSGWNRKLPSAGESGWARAVACGSITDDAPPLRRLRTLAGGGAGIDPKAAEQRKTLYTTTKSEY
jgi:hypothetical protein